MHSRLTLDDEGSRSSINDFIHEAVRQVRDGRETLSAVAARLGLRQALLQKWISFEADTAASENDWDNQLVETLQRENQRLSLECQRLRSVLSGVVGIDEETGV